MSGGVDTGVVGCQRNAVFGPVNYKMVRLNALWFNLFSEETDYNYRHMNFFRLYEIY